MDNVINTDFYRVQMTDDEFAKLSKFIFDNLGIKMPQVKKVMLQSRLHKRLSFLKFSSFKEYIEYIFSPEGEKTELITMIDLVTTNKTDFFREPVHFDVLVQKAIPEMLKSQPHKKMIKIWSAGCSSGEEPYTIAMVLSEYNSKNRPLEYQITATDLSTRILNTAGLAIYNISRISDIPVDIKKKYFLKSKDPNNNTVRIIPELRSKVRFSRLNFMDSVYPVDRDFDIIFCRNVLIYFDRPTQEQVITKLASRLQTGGYFFLGHSESITNMDVPLAQVQPTVFRKK